MTVAVAPAPVTVTPPRAAAPVSRPRRLDAVLGLLAVILATVAVNRLVYVGVRHATGARAIASGGPEFERDAAWEKSLAERLAKPGSTPAVASTGRAPSLTERLRFATLGDAYVVRWTDQKSIASVSARGEPIALDAPAFLNTYGKLFDDAFASAAQVESTDAAVVFSLRAADGRALAKVRFEMDHARRVTAIQALAI